MALILKGRAKLKGSTVIGKRPYAIDGVFNPELVLDFQKNYYRTNSVAKTFPNAITHTRASTATYVDSTGTLQTAAINEPRLGHHVWNGTAWVNEGLLHESEARTNLVPLSVPSTSGWATPSTVLTTNEIASPTGAVDGSKVVANTSNAEHYIEEIVSVTSGSAYTFSVFLKKLGYSNVAFRIPAVGFPNNGVVNVNMDAGTVSYSTGTIDAFGIEDAGNGWFRVYMTRTATATAGALFRIQPNTTDIYIGDNLSGVYIWGAQLEAAPTPSSYIPTSGSTVTRAADVLTIPAANLPYNSTALSIQMDGAINFADEGLAAQQTFLRWQLDTNNLISVDLDTDSTATGEINFNQASSGVFDTVATSGTALAPSIATAFNIASRHGSTFINGALNGTALTADTTPVALANLSASNLNIGFDYMGTIKTLRLWGQDVGNAGISEASS